jgi:hypothetical protein
MKDSTRLILLIGTYLTLPVCSYFFGNYASNVADLRRELNHREPLTHSQVYYDSLEKQISEENLKYLISFAALSTAMYTLLGLIVSDQASQSSEEKKKPGPLENITNSQPLKNS